MNVLQPRTVGRSSLGDFLAPWRKLVQGSNRVRQFHYGSFACDGREYSLPGFVLTGPGLAVSGCLRLGIFATLHGDEPAGALALARFFAELVRQPALAAGYEIRAYPLVNPTGYEDNTRWSRRGKDLNREFWTSSTEPEVLYLEDELWRHHFDGLIALHTDDTSDGLYGFVQGPDLSQELLLPALAAAEEYLPRNEQRIIDGFPAHRGLIQQVYGGVLSAPPEARHRPFELILETPQNAPLARQADAVVAALHRILVEYRTIQALGLNL